jgi:hypothetical protein
MLSLWRELSLGAPLAPGRWREPPNKKKVRKYKNRGQGMKTQPWSLTLFLKGLNFSFVLIGTLYDNLPHSGADTVRLAA